MKQMLFLVVCAFSMFACAPASSTSSVTPTAQAVIDTATPTATSVLDTPTPESTPSSNSSPYISYVKMVDANNGWSLAAGGKPPQNHILRTEDGGSSWMDVTPPQLITVRNHTFWFAGSLSALDANTAWAIADGGESLIGTVWRTDDGGRSWRPGNPIRIYPPGSEMYINGFDSKLNFIDNKVGWLSVRVEGVMAHYIDTWFRTTDGGLNWERASICQYAADAGCNYLFLDEHTGFRTVTNTAINSVADVQTSVIWQIEKTADAGVTWSHVQLPQPTDLVKNLFAGESVQPSDINILSIGQSFAQFKSGVVGVRMDFVAYTANDDYSHPSLQKGYFYISNDAGKTWQYFPFSGDLFFLTDLAGWRFMKDGDAYVLEKTMDGGSNWNSVGGNLSEVGRLQFMDEQQGWVTITRADASTSLLRTLDGGQTWEDITANMLPPLDATDFLSLPSVTSPPGSVEPWIARMETGSPLVLETIQMLDSSNGWGTSLNGYIFHTADGAETWQDVTPQFGTVNPEHDLFVLDASHAWTVITALPICIGSTRSPQCPDYYLNHGPVWYTDDGGKTWNPGGAFPDADRSFESEPIQIRFANQSLGWASWLSREPNDDHPTYHLIKTEDGGRSWNLVLAQPYQGEIGFLDESIGFRSESNYQSVNSVDDFMKGSALPVLDRTTDGGVTWQPVSKPDFVFNLDSLSRSDLAGFSSFCESPEMSFWGTQGVGIRYRCWIPDAAHFFEYYYSPDAGQTWNNWVSLQYPLNLDDQAKWNVWAFGADEFFLDKGIGWRLYRPKPDAGAELQRTVDAGKSWQTIKPVGWQEARFNFIDEREGWAIIVNYDQVALLHTRDGGKSWNEVKPTIH